jgi:undecaprenol kinase/diacylglycerol kinase (ATP)
MENRSKSFSIRKRIQSFKYAFRGLKTVFEEEHNARIHLLAAVIVIVSGLAFRISVLEWLAITLTVGFVISAEIINSSIENLCDFVSPGKNDLIKKIKDLSAAAVLVSAITSVAIGLIVFLPKIIKICFKD